MNFFNDVLNDLDSLEQTLLGPDYKYYKQIKAPSQIGMSSDGNLGAMANDIAGLIAYTELLVTGGGSASKTGGPLGDKFFLKTGAKCKDVKSGNQVTRSLYINNVPNGSIPFISSGLGVDFTVFEGLIPGTMENLAKINPLAIFQAFMGGSNPDCQAIQLETIDVNNNKSTDTQYLTTVDIKNLNPCSFLNGENTITGVKCIESFESNPDRDNYNKNDDKNKNLSTADLIKFFDIKDIINITYYSTLIVLLIYLFKCYKKNN